MIVSDRHGFVFVHVPKCAGSSVRRALAVHDDSGGRFAERVEELPGLGPVDLTHLPLGLLAELFPEDYARLGRYPSFALCRDPVQRFRSALAQRLKMYRGVEIAQLGPREIAAETEAVIEALERQGRAPAPELVHFARQTDFTDRDGVRVVRHVHAVEDIAALAAAIGRIVGAEVVLAEPANRTMVFRSGALRGIARAGSRIAKAALPGALSARLRGAARGVLMRPAGEEADAAFAAGPVRAFIDARYAGDFALHAEALARMRARGPVGGGPGGQG